MRGLVDAKICTSSAEQILELLPGSVGDHLCDESFVALHPIWLELIIDPEPKNGIKLFEYLIGARLTDLFLI